VTEFYVLYFFGGSEDKYRYNLKLGRGRSQNVNVGQVCQLLLYMTTVIEHRTVYVSNVEHILCLFSGLSTL
jgi:hypothetical protein